MPEKRLQKSKHKKLKQSKTGSAAPASGSAKKPTPKKISRKAKSPGVLIKRENEVLSPDILTEMGDLPESYGAAGVILMPVDPYMANIYWEIDYPKMEKLSKRLKGKFNLLQHTLRVCDLDGNHFDVDIDLHAGGRYIDLLCPGKSYFADLGVKTEGGIFFPLIRSNTVEMPFAGPQPGPAVEAVFVSRQEAGRAKISLPERTGGAESKPHSAFIEPCLEDMDLTTAAEKTYSPGISSPSSE